VRDVEAYLRYSAFGTQVPRVEVPRCAGLKPSKSLDNGRGDARLRVPLLPCRRRGRAPKLRGRLPELWRRANQSRTAASLSKQCVARGVLCNAAREGEEDCGRVRVAVDLSNRPGEAKTRKMYTKASHPRPPGTRSGAARMVITANSCFATRPWARRVIRNSYPGISLWTDVVFCLHKAGMKELPADAGLVPQAAAAREDSVNASDAVLLEGAAGRQQRKRRQLGRLRSANERS